MINYPNGTTCSTRDGNLLIPRNISKDGRCGTDYNDTACTNGTSCSEFGWCGTGIKYENPYYPKHHNSSFKCLPLNVTTISKPKIISEPKTIPGSKILFCKYKE